MVDRAFLVASLTEAPEVADLARLSEESDCLEVRADLIGEISAGWLREHYPGELLLTLRSRQEGGASTLGDLERAELLARAASDYDLVDLEGDRDLTSELLDAVPAEKRLISWHGPAASLSALRDRFEIYAAQSARYYKLIPDSGGPGEELAPLALLRSLGRDDVVAFAGGVGGMWTRIVAPRLGGGLVYGSAGLSPAAPGQPTLSALCSDYGLPSLPPVEKVFGIVGNPVGQSLSPRLHNGAYRALGIAALYLPFEVASFGEFWLDVVERGGLDVLRLPLLGLSVTSPFKDVALAVAGASSPLAQRLGAANTLVRSDRVWEAEITDPAGVVRSLAHRGVELAGSRAAVIGAGGAGRAAALGLALAGCRVVLANRTSERGRRAAAALDISFTPLERLDPGAFDIVVHATPLGRPDETAAPLDAERLRPGSTLVDLVYLDRPTPLGDKARERGVTVIDGREVLIFQALRQFRMMTEIELPVELAFELLHLGSGDPQ